MDPHPNLPAPEPNTLPGEPGSAIPRPELPGADPGTVHRSPDESPHVVEGDSPFGKVADSDRTSDPSLSARSYTFLSSTEHVGELGRLGLYRVVRLLGEGGMGFVFRGEDEGLQRSVALKVMRPEIAADPTNKERFLREGRAAAAIKSDHVITIYQVGEANGVPFLAMEYLDGLTLDEWLKNWQKTKNQPVQATAIVRVAKDLLKGLVAAHEKGLIHRDIKPANLWVEAKTSRIKLLDFGLVKMEGLDKGLTRSRQILGTAAYMAPEQARGLRVDARADLFSVGVVLYRMLTGQSPFQQSTYNATIIAVAMDEPAPAASFGVVPDDLAKLIDRMLAKNPDGRPVSAKAALGVVLEVEQQIRRAAEERERAKAERARQEAERLRQEQADRDQAERMERWKLSGMPREWVLKHLDGWGQEDWTALVGELKATPYWPLMATELGSYLESLREEMRAERDRQREAEGLREAEQQRQEAERLRQEQAELDWAERMERWKQSGMPRAWVLAHLDRWRPEDWTALWSSLQSSPYWPLKADELGTYLEALRNDLWAERERQRELERLRETESQRQEAERLHKEQADRDRAERMELWKRSGMPREWVLKHLDKWGPEDWTALWSHLQSTPYWPLEVDELGAYLEGLRDELRAERDRQQDREHSREVEWWRQEYEEPQRVEPRSEIRNPTIQASADEVTEVYEALPKFEALPEFPRSISVAGAMWIITGIFFLILSYLFMLDQQLFFLLPISFGAYLVISGYRILNGLAKDIDVTATISIVIALPACFIMPLSNYHFSKEINRFTVDIIILIFYPICSIVNFVASIFAKYGRAQYRAWRNAYYL